MPRSIGQNIDFEAVRKLARELGDVEDSTAYGSPALKVRGQLLACIAINKSAEPASLAVRIGFEDRAELIASAPDIYYLTGHYENYPVVLVRMSRIQADALKDLLRMGWSFVSAKSARPPIRTAKMSSGRPRRRGGQARTRPRNQ